MTSGPRDAKERERAAELAQGYTAGYAWANRIGVISAVVLAGVWTNRLLTVAPQSAWLEISLMTVLGIMAADLLTGLIHWGCDTWGTPETPWIGRTLIRTFREHHVDPQSITRHDWAEINGEACLGATVIFTGLLLAAPVSAEHFLSQWWLTSFIVAAMFTNQLHKWAHMPRPPRLARWLQRCRLILTPAAHRHHHTRPFVHSYCITTGWMNPVLNTIGFWRLLERALHRQTGALPRQDDLGDEVARDVYNRLIGERPETPRTPLKG